MFFFNCILTLLPNKRVILDNALISYKWS